MALIVAFLFFLAVPIKVCAENLRVITQRSETPFVAVLVFTQNDTLIRVDSTLTTQKFRDKHHNMVRIEFTTVSGKKAGLLYTYHNNSHRFSTITAYSGADTLYVRNFSPASSPISKIEYKNNRPYKKHIFNNVTWQIEKSYPIK